MKIYTRLVIDMASSAVIEEDSIDYDGPIAQCKGGSGKVKETEQEKELARIAGERWDRYQSVFKPLEGTLIKRLDVGTPEREQAAGLANVATQKQFGAAQQQLETGLEGRGVNPASGAGLAAVSGFGDQRAQAGGLSQTDTDQAMTDLQYQGLEHMIQMGRGQAVSGINGLSQVAQSANNRATQNALDAFNERRGNVNAGMAAAGFGLSQYAGMPSKGGASAAGAAATSNLDSVDLAFGGDY